MPCSDLRTPSLFFGFQCEQLIRHAEKRKREKPGLSERGLERAECLRGVFGKGKRREVE